MLGASTIERIKEITRANKGNNFVLYPFQQRSVDVPKK